MATDARLRMLFVALGAVTGVTLMGGCQTNVAAGVTPVAVVGGDQTVNPHEKAILDGTGSYVPGQPSAQLTYRWSLVSAPGTSTVALTDVTTATASLTPVVPGLYVVRLVVSYAGVNSAPAYVDVATFENPLPPIANAGPDQTVDPGVTVTLDGTGSSDPSGSALSYQWTYINGPAATLNLSGAKSATATFTAPGPVGAYVFNLQVTDAHNLTSTDTAIVNVRDVPPVARITGPTSAAEGTTVTLSGTTSSDPNGDPITGYSWVVVKSDVVISLSSNTGSTTSFNIPSLCGKNLTATVSLVVTAGGKQSQVATQTVALQDVINDPPTADAGPNQTVGENVTVTLDGSGSSDCNGDPLTYQWTQQSGPAATLSSATAVNPTFTSPQVYRQRNLVFKLTVSDGRGGTASSTVTITENDTVDEPPVAVATATSPVPVQSTATLDGSASHDPNPGDTLSYKWTQTGGTTVTLSSTTAAKPTFTTPSQPTTLGFKLVVSDGRGMTSQATVSVQVKVGAPDTQKSTLAVAKTSIPADGSTTDLVTVNLKDGAGNGLAGHTVVVHVTPAGLGIGQVTLTDQGGGVYTGNITAGTVAGQATVSFTVDGSSAYPSTKTVTLQPGNPAGTISLAASPTSIAADGSSTSTISTTSAITDANGNTVVNGTEITVLTNLGTITTADADTGRSGIQVKTTNGNISFTLQAGTTTGTANESATSVLGSATGSTTVTLTPPEPAPPLTLTASPSTLTANGAATSTITSGLVKDAKGNTVAAGTLVTVTVTGGTITTADASGAYPGIQVAVDATGHITFTVKAGTTVGNLTITVKNLSGTTLGSKVINLVAGTASGPFTLTANPTSVAADGTSTTSVTSSTITDAYGNTVQNGTSVNVTAGGGCSVTSPQTTTNGVITFTVGPCTTAGSATIGATVAAASASTSITVTPGPAAVLVFSQQPSNTSINTAISPAVQVTVEDANGNVVTGSTLSITLTLTGGTGGAALGGTTTVSAISGVATFANLTVDTGGTGYQLVAAGTGVSNATSTAFDVSSCSLSASLTAMTPVAGSTNALPWDTIVLNPAGSTTCGQSVTVTYSVSPTPATGGFGTWGSLSSGTYTSPSASAVATFYTDDPQTYTFTLTIAGTSTVTATATVTVEPFVALPYGTSSNASAADSRGLALDPGTGDVMIAIQGNGGQAAGQLYRPTSTAYTTIDIGCLTGNHGRSPVFDGTHFWMAYDDSRSIDEITQFFGPCTKTTETPVATQGNNPTKTRSMTIMNNVIYMATDKDLFGWALGPQTFTEYDIAAFGNDHDYSAIAPDLAGNIWWASNNNGPDGAAESTPPPDPNAPRLNYFAGTDDLIRCAVGAQDPSGTTNEMWLGTNGNGLIEVPDVTSPGTGTQITSGGSYDNVRGGAYDAASHDVWFATQAGLIRYKADVGAVALIPKNEAGLGNLGDSSAVLFDEGTTRGRIIFYATNIGVFYATAPP